MKKTIFIITISFLFQLYACTESPSMLVRDKIDLLNFSIEEDFESMNEEDWNKWTEEIRTWLEDVDNHMAKSIAAGMDEDVVEECIDDIQKHLARVGSHHRQSKAASSRRNLKTKSFRLRRCQLCA